MGRYEELIEKRSELEVELDRVETEIFEITGELDEINEEIMQLRKKKDISLINKRYFKIG